jgi:hypothetical protein
VGRIYQQRGGPDSMRWFWSLYGMLGKPVDMHTNGHAATLDEATAQFETAWRRWLAFPRRDRDAWRPYPWAALGASPPR